MSGCQTPGIHFARETQALQMLQPREGRQSALPLAGEMTRPILAKRRHNPCRGCSAAWAANLKVQARDPIGLKSRFRLRSMSSGSRGPKCAGRHLHRLQSHAMGHVFAIDHKIRASVESLPRTSRCRCGLSVS